MYGFVSLFTGVVIYNSMLYVLFNLCYTALPVIWFATNDYEYPKHVIVKRPRLYKIGIENVYFNSTVFWRWIFYAFWQSTLIVFLVFFSLDHLSSDARGDFGGIWMAGSLVFTTLVIVSNMKIMISSYLYNGWMLFFVIGSVLFYFLTFWLLSRFITSSDQYNNLHELCISTQTYLIVILFSFMFVLTDTGLQYLNIYINKWYLAQKELAIKQQQQRDKQSKSVIRRKVTSYKNRGFAFSGEAGNSQQVTDKLSSRIGFHLL